MTAPDTGPAHLPSAGFRRRFAAMVYEALIVVALAFLAGLAFVLAYAALVGDARVRMEGGARLALQVCVVSVLGVYFVWFWRRGHTLPMKTWRLRLVAADGGAVGTRAAIVRYAIGAATLIPSLIGALDLRQHPSAVLSWLALAPGVFAVAWCAWDRDGQALYDRIARTRLVRVDTTAAPR